MVVRGAPYARGASLARERIAAALDGRSVCAWGFPYTPSMKPISEGALRMRVGLPCLKFPLKRVDKGAPYARGASLPLHEIDIWSDGRSVCAWGFLPLYPLE